MCTGAARLAPAGGARCLSAKRGQTPKICARCHRFCTLGSNCRRLGATVAAHADTSAACPRRWSTASPRAKWSSGRPRALKELVENAIDAGATRIAVRIERGRARRHRGDRRRLRDDARRDRPRARAPRDLEAARRGDRASRHPRLSRRGAALDRQRRAADDREPAVRGAEQGWTAGGRSRRARRAKARPRCRPARASGSSTCSPKCPRGASSCARRAANTPPASTSCAGWRWPGPRSASPSSTTGGAMLGVQPGDGLAARVAPDRRPRAGRQRRADRPRSAARCG